MKSASRRINLEKMGFMANVIADTGVLIDEAAYEGLLETIRILQENPGIVQSLEERENGLFVDERDTQGYGRAGACPCRDCGRLGALSGSKLPPCE